MASFLEGRLAKALYRGMKPHMLKGRLRKTIKGATPNSYGEYPVTPVYYDCRGFDGRYSDYFKKTALVPIEDGKIYIFSQSLPAGVRPEKDDMVYYRGQWHQLRDADIDPAHALWKCQAFVVPAPVDPAP